MTISNEKLAAAIKAAEDAAKVVVELKEQSRAEDLKTVKELISRHGFLQKDLTPELKTRGAVKKVMAPRKTVGRRKTK
jgi:NAD(P)-dependent dehydrogenase (short-subunit alcohol dehydrogenase family)